MGCLEFIVEFIFEGIFEAWFMLMTLIIPDKMANKKHKKLLKVLIYIFTALLMFGTVIGLCAVLSQDSEVRLFGKYVFSICAGLCFIQILIGIILRRKRKKK